MITLYDNEEVSTDDRTDKLWPALGHLSDTERRKLLALNLSSQSVLGVLRLFSPKQLLI